MAAYLDTIVAAHRATAAGDPRPLGTLLAEAQSFTRARMADDERSFADALVEVAARRGVAIIAEIKRRSPSRGILDTDLDPTEVASQYADGGAACLSVLTDEAFFGGSAADLGAARVACRLPVLRKDFTVSASDVCDTRLMGADAVLLIVAALDDRELAQLMELAGQLRLTALVEVHDRDELERAFAAGATVIGVNQRNLRSFEVDRRLAVSLAEHFRPGTIAVAESGIGSAADVVHLADAGYHGVLVGEALVRAGDRHAAVSALAGSVSMGMTS